MRLAPCSLIPAPALLLLPDGGCRLAALSLRITAFSSRSGRRSSPTRPLARCWQPPWGPPKSQPAAPFGPPKWSPPLLPQPPACRAPAPHAMSHTQQQVPVLEVDGKMICQSGAIDAYCARVAGLAPTDDWLVRPRRCPVPGGRTPLPPRHRCHTPPRPLLPHRRCRHTPPPPPNAVRQDLRAVHVCQRDKRRG